MPPVSRRQGPPSRFSALTLDRTAEAGQGRQGTLLDEHSALESTEVKAREY